MKKSNPLLNKSFADIFPSKPKGKPKKAKPDPKSKLKY